MSTIDKLPTRRFAHPFDRPVKVEGDQKTYGVDHSPDAIGGCYGMGWLETFRCHRSGQVYAVHCSDGVNSSKSAHSSHDLEWMEAMRERIIFHTTRLQSSVIKLSTREWALMLGYTFRDWLDFLPGEDRVTTGDANRHLDEGQVGTIGGTPVVVDPEYIDDLPPIDDFDGWEPRRTGRAPAVDPRREPTRFEGVFEAAFAKAGLRAP